VLSVIDLGAEWLMHCGMKGQGALVKLKMHDCALENS
jgi:hypothetical protein